MNTIVIRRLLDTCRELIIENYDEENLEIKDALSNLRKCIYNLQEFDLKK